MKEREKRNSGIEALRIIAMLMIIAYHYVVHGKAIDTAGGGTKLFLECASLWGKAGVNLFFLIMGYFGIQSEFKIKKIILIEAQTIFYSLLGLCIALIFKSEINLSFILATFFPFIYTQYWFITAYIMVCILTPYLNITLLGLNEIQYRRLIIIIMTFWCIIPFFSLQGKTGLFWNQFIWSVVMYVVGGYIKIYKKIFSKGTYKAIIITNAILLILSVIGSNWLSRYYQIFGRITAYNRWSNSPLIVCTCIAMIRLIECKQIRYKKWINYLATGTLGIYLFHENIFIREILWNKLFNNAKYFNFPTIVIHIILTICCIYLVGSVIDIFRRFIFSKIKTVLDSFSDRIEKMVKDYEQKIDKILSDGC